MGEILGGLFVLTLIVCVIGGAMLYLLPTIIAVRSKHPYESGVVILNIFLGWTLIGWVGALVWAVSGRREYTV